MLATLIIIEALLIGGGVVWLARAPKGDRS